MGGYIEVLDNSYTNNHGKRPESPDENPDLTVRDLNSFRKDNGEGRFIKDESVDKDVEQVGERRID
jgi:hypothetical protein